MRIDLSGVEPYMAQHGLDVADVSTSFEHECRRVAQVREFLGFGRGSTVGEYCSYNSSESSETRVPHSCAARVGVFSDAERVEALLRAGRSAFHYVQLLSPAAFRS